MRLRKLSFSSWMGLLVTAWFILFTLTACNKSPSNGKVAEKSYAQVSTNVLKQQRFVWNYQTLVEPYEMAGYGKPAWDEPARRALTEFARIRAQATETNEPWGQIIGTNCDLAVKAGCNDPMIAYLHTKFSLSQTNSREVFADALRKGAQGMQQSSYPEIRKFYACFRTAQQFEYAWGTNHAAETEYFWGLAITNLGKALQDKSMPVTEVDEACNEAADELLQKRNERTAFYYEVEVPLFNNWTNTSVSWLLKGRAFIDWAWAKRGGGYANTVNEEGWKSFTENLDKAEQSLARAWEMNPNDPRIPTKMLTVELGQGKGRDRMELWFGRAMAINTNNYDACNAKRYYLEPKWHGSEEDMLAFGWECLESTAWGGKVPLILFDAHVAISRYLDKSEQDDYWKRPEVWPDVQASFDRFFELNPHETGWYHDYVKYAYRCERWDKLNELIPKLGRIKYTYFGGKDEFEKMARLAKEHANDAMPRTDSLPVEFKRLTAKIASKTSQGKETEKDFERELEQCDALLNKYKDRKTDDVAQILFMKAMLYLQTFNNTSKGTELIIELKRDFPDTKLAQGADKVLTLIAKQEEAEKIQRSLAEGTAFPDFDVQDVAGKPLSLANYKGRVVLIDFWATWCGPCVAELPSLLKTYEKHHGNGFEIIGISLDEDQTKLEDFMKQKKMTWQQFFDGQGWQNKLGQKYGVNSIPATYLLDGEGKIIAKDLRGDDLEAAVARALSKK